jgi:glycosyltransferase involved in cell wall biosynthesis
MVLAPVCIFRDFPSRMATGRLSLLHRSWRLLPQRRRREAMAFGAALLAPRPKLPPPAAADGVIVAGELSRATGLGEGARLMLRALQHLGVPCWPRDISALLPAHAEDMAPPAGGVPPPPGAALVLHVNPPLLPLVLMRLHRLAHGRRVIGYWAWELPVPPGGWGAGARLVHAAWVPSRFTAASVAPIMRRPGDEAVHVVPHPLALAPPVAAPLDRAAFGLPQNALVVLVSANLASSFVRKNPLAAVAAFRAAFGDRPDRILVLKVGKPDHAPGDFAQLRAAVGDARNIRLETRTLPAADAHALTQAADIVLSLHRSEGFGLVLAEAMLLGRPVIATGWSGNMTFMDESNSVPVPFTMAPAADPRGVYAVPGATWAEADVQAAAAALRELADNPGRRAGIGARARSSGNARLGASPLAEAVRALGLEGKA